MARILAIEPDPEHGATLRQLIADKLGAHLVLATSSGAAIAALAGEPPDVILTSSLIQPADDRQLATHLRENPSLRHLPILALPPIVEPQETPDSTLRGLLARLVGRRTTQWKVCDFEAVAARIKETIEEARAAAASPTPAAPVIEPAVALPPITDEELRAFCGLGMKQNRARRWTGADLPWLSSIRLSWGLELGLLNISCSGILVESGIRLTPGSRTDIHLGGPNKELVVPARVVRSRVAAVDQRGVKYQAAAEFERAFDALMPGTTDRPADPAEHLEDLVARVREGAAGGASPLDLRLEFEAGVHELVNAREIRLRETPVVENDGSDSVYFTIPTHNNSPAVLQATFEPRCQPCLEEFEALKAASVAAAEVLEFTQTSRQLSLVTV